jgi:hypothetical protein
MRSVATAIFILSASPALASTCWFENPAQDRLTFLDNGENELVIQKADGQTETCDYGLADNGVSTIWCDYESKTQSGYEVTGQTLHAFGALWTKREDCQ